MDLYTDEENVERVGDIEGNWCPMDDISFPEVDLDICEDTLYYGIDLYKLKK